MTDASGRLALLRATIVVVGRGGLRALTYRAIAAEAGVSHGLVRHHFGTRHQLIAEAMDFAVDESLHSTNMLGPSITIDEFAVGIETLSKSEEDSQAFQYELLLESRRRPELKPIAERYYRTYTDAILARLDQLGIHDQALRDLIWFALDGIVFKQLVIPGETRPAIEKIRQILAQY